MGKRTYTVTASQYLASHFLVKDSQLAEAASLVNNYMKGDIRLDGDLHRMRGVNNAAILKDGERPPLPDFFPAVARCLTDNDGALTIIETLQREIPVTAGTEEEALAAIQKMMDEGDLVLRKEDYRRTDHQLTTGLTDALWEAARHSARTEYKVNATVMWLFGQRIARWMASRHMMTVESVTRTSGFRQAVRSEAELELMKRGLMAVRPLTLTVYPGEDGWRNLQEFQFSSLFGEQGEGTEAYQGLQCIEIDIHEDTTPQEITELLDFIRGYRGTEWIVGPKKDRMTLQLVTTGDGTVPAYVNPHRRYGESSLTDHMRHYAMRMANGKATLSSADPDEGVGKVYTFLPIKSAEKGTPVLSIEPMGDTPYSVRHEETAYDKMRWVLMKDGKEMESTLLGGRALEAYRDLRAGRSRHQTEDIDRAWTHILFGDTIRMDMEKRQDNHIKR